MASEYPDIMSLTSIGQSVQERGLWVMNISDNIDTQEPDKPEFKYIANMHGDETIGRDLSLQLINWLADNYFNDSSSDHQRAVDLVDNTDIYIMPSMNPDGFEILSRYNINGTDFNRDFPDQFSDPT